MNRIMRCSLVVAIAGALLLASGAALAQENYVDLALYKDWQPLGDYAVAGGYAVVALQVGNYGEVDDAYNVVVQDFMPAGVTPVDFLIDRGSITMGVPGDPARPFTWRIGYVGAYDEPVQLLILVRIDPSVPEGTLWNDAVVYADSAYIYDYDISNNSATAALDVSTEADLEVEMYGPFETDNVSGPNAQVFMGDMVAGTVVTYEVDVTNYGPSTARSVLLWDWVQHGMSIQGARIVGGDGTVTVLDGEDVGSDLACYLGDIAPMPGGEIMPPEESPLAAADAAAGTDTGRRMIMVDVLVLPEAYWYASTLWHYADVVSGDWEYEYTYDPFTENNMTAFYGDVIGMVDIAVSKTADVTTVAPGGAVTYTITASNLGPSDATEVNIFDEVPDGMTITGVTTNQTEYLQYDEEELWWGLLVLRAGESATLQLHTVVDDDSGLLGAVLYNDAWYEFESQGGEDAPKGAAIEFQTQMQPSGYFFDPNYTNDDAIAAVTVALDDSVAQLPDLRCEWVATNRRNNVIKGVLLVTNAGSGIAGRFRVLLGGSNDGATPCAVDREVRVRGLAPGGSIYLTVRHKTGKDGKNGNMLIGVADYLANVDESLENNNVAVWGAY